MMFQSGRCRQTKETSRLNYFLMVDPEKIMSGEETPQGANMLLDGMHTSISDLDERLANEKDEKAKRELEQKKDILEKALTLRTAPINNAAELKDAIDTIKHDQFLLERLGKEEFDQIDIKFLMESDLMPFFDDTAQGQLAASFEQMNTSDFVQSTLRPGTVHIEGQPGKARKLVGFPNVMQASDPKVIEKIKLTLIEAQYIRVESILAYLKKRFEALRKLVMKNKAGFEKETMNSLEAELDEAHRLLFDHKGEDPGFLETVAENIEAATVSFKVSEDEMRKVMGEARPQAEAQVISDFERLQALIPHFAQPENTEEYKAYLAHEGIPENSAILNKGIDHTSQLADPNSEIRKKMSEFGQRLQNISEISDEELLAIKKDLDTLSKTLNVEDAKLAHKTIEKLEKASSPDQVKAIIEAKLGAEHLELVSHAEFEKEHRETTPEGDMVFEKEGNKWKIIIDETVFSKGGDLIRLKKQIIHELLHVEFEKNSRIKDDVRKAYIGADQKHWEKIRTAFVKYENAEGKKAPDGGDWKDDDSHDDYILSEIYAMQNELSNNFIEERGSTKEMNKVRLHNLILGAGIGTLGNIAKKAREYEDDNEETKKKREKFGYSGGADEDTGKEESESGTSGSGPDKEEHAVHKKNKEQIDHIRKRLEELGKSEHLSKVSGGPELVSAMSGYNDATEDLNNDLLKEEDGEIIATTITIRNEKISEDLNDVEDKVGKAARKSPNTEMGLLRKLWINTTFLSMQDFVQLGVNTYEFIKRRHDRNVADHAAKLGMALLHGTDMGREARAAQQKAEADEVNEWKSRYENLDAWQLEKELKGIADGIVPNADQVKAILRILAEKGRFSLHNQDLWKVLNKLQSAVLLKPGDQILLHNPILLRQKLHTALGEIYDYDEFPKLVRDQESSYQSGKGKYDTENNRTQDVLTARLDELLAHARDGERVDPMQFESILEYGIKNGKSYAENVMFHLIAGMACGLLAPDRGLALGEHLNIWPSVDWFSTMKPPMTTADWERYALQNFKRDFLRGTISEDGYGGSFKNWFWTVVQNNDRVIERVKKSVSERGWDHDWGRSIACLGDADTAKRFLSGRSGQQETKVTGVSNAYVGVVQWLEENAENPQYANKAEFARKAGWIAMSEGILDGTAYNRGDQDINTRANEAMNQDMPREARFGNHSDFNTGQHRELTQQFLFTIDAGFFGMLSGVEARSNEQKQELGIRAKEYLIKRYPSLDKDLGEIEDISQIYNNLDLIIGAMFNKMSEAEFQRILANVVARIPAK